MSAAIIGMVAERFKLLAEPARLELLQSLRSGEKSVSQLVADTGMGQASVSKHLNALHLRGFVDRRREGAFAYYKIAHRDIFTLCEIMCSHLAVELEKRPRIARAL